MSESEKFAAEIFSPQGQLDQAVATASGIAYRLGELAPQAGQEVRESAIATAALESLAQLHLLLGALGIPDERVAGTYPSAPLFEILAPYRHDTHDKLR